jgi:hypothetical protein
MSCVECGTVFRKPDAERTARKVIEGVFQKGKKLVWKTRKDEAAT